MSIPETPTHQNGYPVGSDYLKGYLNWQKVQGSILDGVFVDVLDYQMSGANPMGFTSWIIFNVYRAPAPGEQPPNVGAYVDGFYFNKVMDHDRTYDLDIVLGPS